MVIQNGQVPASIGHAPLAVQEHFEILIWPDPCLACGEKAIVGRANYKLIPTKLISVEANQAKVAGQRIPVTAFHLCIACGKRSKLVPKGGKWVEVTEVVPGEGGSPGAIG